MIGGQVTLTGTHLDRVARVEFGTGPSRQRAFTFTSSDGGTQLHVTVPNEVNQDGPITVGTDYAGTRPGVHTAGDFHLISPDVVTSSTPLPVGSAITITGRHLETATAVTVDARTRRSQ